MTSLVYTSKNFYDLELILKDLTEDLKKQNITNALGIMFCDARVDVNTLVPKLQKELIFPVVGGTTLSIPFTSDDKSELSTSLLVIRSDRYKFSFALSDTMDAQKHSEQTKSVYKNCMERLGEKPKLVMPFLPHMPGFPMDAFIEDIFRAADGVPVFGGVVTGDLISTGAFVFADGKLYRDSMLLVMFSGDIKPVFAIGNTITLSETDGLVTESKGNLVQKIGDMTFCNYMRSIGVEPEKRVNGLDALMQYGPLPVVIKRKDKQEDGVPEVRCISYTNVEEGSAVFSGEVPAGSHINMGVLHVEDVESSVKASLDFLMGQVSRQKDDYSVLLCISCVARYFVFAGEENMERKLLTEKKHEKIAATGYYGFCEIGPTYEKSSGNIINRSHSASIIFCVF